MEKSPKESQLCCSFDNSLLVKKLLLFKSLDAINFLSVRIRLFIGRPMLVLSLVASYQMALDSQG